MVSFPHSALEFGLRNLSSPQDPGLREKPGWSFVASTIPSALLFQPQSYFIKQSVTQERYFLLEPDGDTPDFACAIEANQYCWEPD